ncbi:MAG: MFS transporter [Dehalococcoidia bacterium]
MAGIARVIDERFPALRSRDYLHLFVNGFFTTGARWTQVLGQGWLVHDLTDSATAVGAVTFASFIPFVVVGPIAGAMADRIDRLKLLVGATVAGVIVSALLTAVTLSGSVQAWHILVLAWFSGAALATSVPPRQALIANSVPEEQLLNAVAVSGIAQHGSRVVGPLFGAALLATLGAGSVFALSTGLLLVGLIELSRVGIRADHATTPAGRNPVAFALRSVGTDLRRALSYVVHDGRVATVIGLVGFHCGLTMAFDSMMPSLATRVGGGRDLYSSIIVGLGLGAIVGTLTVSLLRSPAAEARALTVSAVGSGLAIMSLGLAPASGAVIAAAVFAGATQATYMALSATLIQRVVPDTLRARVMSLYILIAAGHMAIVNLGFGRAADFYDVRSLLIVPGVVWILLFLGASVLLPQLRSLVRRGEFLPRAAVLPLPAGGD